MNVEACTKRITDPRKPKNRYYRLDSLIFLIFSAVISGYDTTESIVEFGRLKLNWLQKHVDLPRIPCRETLRFLLASLKADELIKGFEAFVAEHYTPSGDCISIDGKTMRGTGKNGVDALHVVSAWSGTAGLTLCALASEGKKNEIKTVPKVLDKINIEGAVVSLDAMGCQREISSRVIAGGGDYMLQIKGNQSALLEEVKAYEHRLIRENFKDCHHDTFEEFNKEHGRLESRKYTHFELSDWVSNKSKWEGAETIVRVERTREISGKSTTETSWYLSSLSVDAKKAAKSIRSHWSCENQLHWRLDVIFQEDKYSSNNCAFSMATIKRFCMNLIKSNDISRRYLKHKVMACAIDDDYRSQILLSV